MTAVEPLARAVRASRQRARAVASFLIRRRRIALLAALVLGIAGLTGVTVVLGQSLSARLASQIEAELEGLTLRSAQDLSTTIELEPARLNDALRSCAALPDVQAIAAEVGDRIVASRGTILAVTPVFAALPGTLVRGDDHIASWAAAIVEGVQVGKIAVVVSTRRLADARALQGQALQLALIAGAAAAILGALVIVFLTRQAGGATLPLAGDAPRTTDTADALPGGLPDQLADRTRERDELTRHLQLVLGHATQGFLTVDLGGRLVGPRSAPIARWLGEPGPDTTIAGYLGVHDYDLATQLGRGLEAICAGTPVAQGLAQLPTRLTTGATILDLRYAALIHDDKPERILITVDDVTESVTRERKQREEREQRELVGLTQLITGDRPAFDEFFAEAAGLVASLDAPSDAEAERRALRTLKDNCAYYGLDTYVELCQQIETSMVGSESPISDAQRVALASGWGRIASQLVGKLA